MKTEQTAGNMDGTWLGSGLGSWLEQFHHSCSSACLSYASEQREVGYCMPWTRRWGYSLQVARRRDLWCTAGPSRQLANLGNAIYIVEQISGHRHPGRESTDGHFCTRYQHLDIDPKGKVCLFPVSLTRPEVWRVGHSVGCGVLDMGSSCQQHIHSGLPSLPVSVLL